MDFTLSIIDFSSYRGSDAVSRKEMIHEIYQATQDAGFFSVLKNFGIAPEHNCGCIPALANLFRAACGKKKRDHKEIAASGYDGIEAQAFDPSKPGDLKESFSFRRNQNATAIEPEAGVPWAFMANQPNKWPDSMPEFRAHLLSFFSECGDLVEDVLGATKRRLNCRRLLQAKSHATKLQYEAYSLPGSDGPR